MTREAKRAVMIIANTLHYKFEMNRSESLKQAWQMMKNGFKSNISDVTYGAKQGYLSTLKENCIQLHSYIQREDNRCNSKSLILVINGVKVGYLRNKSTIIINALIEKGIRVLSKVLEITGGRNDYKYGLSVGFKLAS